MKDIAFTIFALAAFILAMCEATTPAALTATKVAALVCGYIAHQLYKYDQEYEHN